VKNKALWAMDFRPGDLPRGPVGTTGATGPQGAQGPQGPQGGPGLSGLETVLASTPNNSDSPKSVSANCPVGKTAISAQYNVLGGKTGASPNELVEVVVDQIGTFGFQGFVDAYETDPIAGAWEVDLEVLCARVNP
jgi:hypothetical protein